MNAATSKLESELDSILLSGGFNPLNLSVSDLHIDSGTLSDFVVLDDDFKKVDTIQAECLRHAVYMVQVFYPDGYTVIPLNAFHDIFSHV